MSATGFLTGDLAEALHGEMVPKFLATIGPDGQPNVVVCTSLDAADGNTLFFGHFLLWKSRKNLDANPRVAVAVMTEDLRVWTLKGRFREWLTAGPLMERMNEKEFFRYNAYIRISSVGVIDVEDLTATWNLSTASVAMDLLPARAAAYMAGAGQGPRMPPRVAEKFARTQAMKALAFTDRDGYPRILPVFSLWPTGGERMYFGTGNLSAGMDDLPDGTEVAVNVLTMEPVSYQVKGVLDGPVPGTFGHIRRLRIDQVFSACPPLAGEPIEMQSQR